MRPLFTLIALSIVGSAAQAHFIWLEPVKNDDGTTTVQVYFGEDASPDDPSYLGRLKAMKLQQVSGTNEPTDVATKLTDESLSAAVPSFDGQSLFIAAHDLGVFDRGDAKFRLRYYAKTGPAITSDAWRRTVTSDDLRLDLVPTIDDGEITVSVTFDGQPVPGAEVKASGPGLDDFTGETDEKGQATFAMAEAGVYSLRARHIEAEAGELNGKTYPETRHYTTAAVQVPAPLSQVAFEELATINDPVTSFGAALVGDMLYVYGGHTGALDSYSNTEQRRTLSRLNLKTRGWEDVLDGPPLQGLALVAHDGKLYRIGGFTAKNAEGDDHDLWSQDVVTVFDPAAPSWSELPPLPEPRSSFDAAVMGDAIYVVGGWSLQGDADTHWHTTGWKLDLSQDTPEWQPLPSPPFQRRALAVAAHNGKIYAIGGMQEEGGPTRQVDVFDPKTGEWSKGPEILGDDGFTGFGASAFAAGGRLYVSTIKGTLQRLSDDGTAWEMVGKTPTARFFHRMLPLDAEHLLVVGGANMKTGKFDAVELLSVGQ